MSYIGFPYSINEFYSPTYDASIFTGDGSTTTFNLTFFGRNAESLFVFVNGVQQTPDSDYTVSLNVGLALDQIEFTTAPTNSSEIVIRYKV